MPVIEFLSLIFNIMCFQFPKKHPERELLHVLKIQSSAHNSKINRVYSSIQFACEKHSHNTVQLRILN